VRTLAVAAARTVAAFAWLGILFAFDGPTCIGQ
jgi:hypothetical protein